MRKITKILLSPWTALITLAVVIGVRAYDPTFVESVRLRYFDTVIASREPTENNIVTVNIDESALDKYGQWPFNRKIYAELIEDLYKRNAGLVVFNVLMPETDRQGGDQALAKTLEKAPVVLPNMPAGQNKNEPRKPSTAVIGAEHSDTIIQYPGIMANIPPIESQAAGVGIVNTLPEVDGVNRRLPLVVVVNGVVYPSLAMEALRVAAGDSTTQIKLNESGVEKMRIPKFGPVATDSLGRVWIDWSQRSHSVSITELPDDFGGAVVIIGVAAAGLGNPVPTSVGSQWPHEVQAAVLGTMINGVVIQRPDWADSAEILFLAMAGILLLFLSRWTYVGIVSSVVIIGSIWPGSGYLYTNGLNLVDSTWPIFGLLVVVLHAYGVKFVSEFLQKQQIKRQFGSYVNPTVVERLQKNPELIKLGGERKQLSIVMTDLRGFTTLGESFGDDVEGLTQIMNDYMTALSVPVLKNDGTLIKFIGDASLHVHGAPLDDPDHAYTAVITAQQMIQAIEEFNKELTAKGRPPVGMGAGVNTGETLIGNIGSKEKFGYDVLGDSVSTAARLEGQTKGYGVLLIIGPNTNEQVQDRIMTLELDNIAVKGKTVGLRIYTPLTVLGDVEKYQAAQKKHAEMLAEYRAQHFETAVYLCDELKGEFDGQMDHYYEIWRNRCREMKMRQLSKDWDGVYHATSK
jgi:adenylate cyclase